MVKIAVDVGIFDVTYLAHSHFVVYSLIFQFVRCQFVKLRKIARFDIFIAYL